MKKMIFTFVILGILLSGCASQKQATPVQPPNTTPPEITQAGPPADISGIVESIEETPPSLSGLDAVGEELNELDVLSGELGKGKELENLDAVDESLLK